MKHEQSSSGPLLWWKEPVDGTAIRSCDTPVGAAEGWSRGFVSWKILFLNPVMDRLLSDALFLLPDLKTVPQCTALPAEYRRRHSAETCVTPEEGAAGWLFSGEEAPLSWSAGKRGQESDSLWLQNKSISRETPVWRRVCTCTRTGESSGHELTGVNVAGRRGGLDTARAAVT